jgi:heat shock protein 1/8
VDNNWLGEFELSPIPAAPKGVASMKTCFEIDANGILNVSAVEKTSGVSYNITITNYKASLSTEEIHRMVLDAKKFEVEDDKHRKKVKAKEALENYAYKMRSIVNDKEIGDKFDAASKEKIEAAIKHVIRWLDGIQHAEVDEFVDKLIGLELICNPIIAKIFRQE